jgi:hypothetical protein
MMDFVTIVFNDKIELQLFQIQAASFKLVDNNIINHIYIVFNDDIGVFHEFREQFYKKIIKYYPEYLVNKIKLLSLHDIGLKFNQTSWFTQQIVKVHIAKFIETFYYIILDGKNHFKEKIIYDDFFYNNKPILNFNIHGEPMLKFYNNCLNYFNVECPYKNNSNKFLKIQTITPFIFIKEISIQLINYIENRENMSFTKFINDNKKYTEFFLYYSFLIFMKKSELYYYSNKQYVITIGCVDPKIHPFNGWENKKPCLENKEYKVISLHRGSIKFLDKEYKDNLFNFYCNNYKDIKIKDTINSILF